MSDQAEEQSLEEKMVNILDAEVVEEEVEEVEVAEEVEEAEEPEEEQPLVTLKVNGEDIEKPLEEVISLAQQGMDYTQKTQKVADERKALEQYAQTIKVQETQFQEQVQMQQALIQDIAQLTSVDNQLSQFEKTDWEQMSNEDPVGAQRLFFRYSQLQTQRGQMANLLAQKQTQLDQEKANRAQQLIQQGKEELARDIPGWNDDMAREILQSGKNYGFAEAELNTVLDPRVVKVLHDALQWKKLQANPSSKQKISQAKPMVKPGAKDSKQQANSQTRFMRDELRKTGDKVIAEKLIESML